MGARAKGRDVKLHDEPNLGEVVAAIISLIAICLIGFLAIEGNQAAQTSLVAVAGAAAGTYFQPRRENGNGSGKPGATPPPTVAPRA